MALHVFPFTMLASLSAEDKRMNPSGAETLSRNNFAGLQKFFSSFGHGKWCFFHLSLMIGLEGDISELNENKKSRLLEKSEIS